MFALFIYRITLRLYFLTIRIVAPFHDQASRWLKGRAIPLPLLPFAKGKRIWFHCASLGEFEQARPLIDLLEKEHPEAEIMLTFFSPSGYDSCKHLPYCFVGYLPEDLNFHTSGFLDKLKPDLAVFIRYELWYYTLLELKNKNIPSFLVGALIRPQSIYLKPWGVLHRKMLRFFSAVFVQDNQSAALISSFLSQPVVTCGDPRIDRVITISSADYTNTELDGFCSEKTLIAGSIWPEDVPVLQAFLNDPRFTDWKVVCFPHQINRQHQEKWIEVWGQRAAYSGFSNPETRLLLIPKMGVLSKAYRYGQIAYVGGGFGHAVHNVLEAAVYGLGVICGPAMTKSREAGELSRLGALAIIQQPNQIADAVEKLVDNKECHALAKNYVHNQTGASVKILPYLQQFL